MVTVVENKEREIGKMLVAHLIAGGFSINEDDAKIWSIDLPKSLDSKQYKNFEVYDPSKAHNPRGLARICGSRVTCRVGDISIPNPDTIEVSVYGREYMPRFMAILETFEKQQGVKDIKLKLQRESPELRYLDIDHGI